MEINLSLSCFFFFSFSFFTHKVSTALDPRFKDLKCLPRADREAVWEKLSELVKEEESAAQPPREPSAEPSAEPPQKKPALLLMGSESESDEETRVDNTVERYKVEPSAGLEQCPLEWWSTRSACYGNMAKIARKYLGTPATSVPCERLFSLAGHIVQKRRANLSPDNVNRLVCLSDWWKKEK